MFAWKACTIKRASHRVPDPFLRTCSMIHDGNTNEAGQDKVRTLDEINENESTCVAIYNPQALYFTLKTKVLLYGDCKNIPGSSCSKME